VQPVSLESRLDWFAAHSPEQRPLWVFDESGNIRGWVSLQSFYGRPAYDATAEVSIYVATQHARRGIAGSMLDALLKQAPSLGVEHVVAFVFGHNVPSLKLFESRRFERWGLLPRVARLDDIERDLVILGRHVL
jgi:phosphinothricin acetyltransferase